MPESTPPYTPPSYTPPPSYPTGPIAPDSSGVTLGVFMYQVGARVIVQRVMPGTPADGSLFPNDQLVKCAFRDAKTGRVEIVRIRSTSDLTQLKTLAGAGTQVALQLYRPTTGYRSFFVNVQTPRGSGAVYVAAPTTIREDNSGAAAAMLGGNDVGVTGGFNPQPQPFPNRGGDTPESLLNGN